MARPASARRSWRKILRRVGPGIVTGASDDDPSGIGTYSQVGAQFGFGMLWTMLFTLPLMSSVQEASALIGRATGHGLATNIRKYHPGWLVYPLVVALVVANFINIGADLGAMGAGMTLVVGGPAIIWVMLFGVVCVLAELFIPYHRYSSVLKWLTLSLLAYVGTVLVVHLDWRSAIISTFVPRISFNKDTLIAIVAVLGTTISPYLFFWQASQEVEEITVDPASQPLVDDPPEAINEVLRIKLDTYGGMFASNLIAWFIIASTGATLFVAGVHDIDSANKAAEALTPIAGRFGGALFALGIIATGLLAIPVLAGSAAFGVAESFRWRASLEEPPKREHGFYGVIIVGVLIGIFINFIGVNPIHALIWTAVINAVVAPPLIAIVMLMAGSKRVMGETRAGIGVRIIGWITVAVMSLAVVGMFWSFAS